jgi:uncharacterized protein (DUF302 family)
VTGDSGAHTEEYVRGVESRVSLLPLEETVSRLVSLIEARGLRLFDVIDHQAAAMEVGLALRPTRVLVFGSPAAGTPLMVDQPLLALELPLRILAWEGTDGRVHLSHLTADALVEQFQLDPAKAAALGGPAALIDEAIAAMPGA